MCLAFTLWLASLAGCTSRPPLSAGPEPVARCDYGVVVGADLLLEITARCDGPLDALIAHEPSMVEHIQLPSGKRLGSRFELAVAASEVSYRVDLLAVAAQAADPDVAHARDGGCIAAGSTWLLEPSPSRGDTRIHVQVQPAEGVGFATGLRRDRRGHWLEAREIRFATYGVFGRFEREQLVLPGPISGDAEHAILQLVTLPGSLQAHAAQRRAWVERAARAVGTFWHGFPVAQSLVAIVPSEGARGIEHGKVVASGGASILLSLGSEATEETLYDDWVLIHEMFHLGFPSFVGEGKWLDEGLATYYEPIVRARDGWQLEEDVWREFSRYMPQGLIAVQEQGVEGSDDAPTVYWGGAILALLADVRVREASAGARGLEDGLVAVLARGGNATQVWKLGRATAVIDEALGAPVMSDLMAAHVHRGSAAGFEELIEALGVQRRGADVSLRQDAPLSHVRRAIVHPGDGWK